MKTVQLLGALTAGVTLVSASNAPQSKWSHKGFGWKPSPPKHPYKPGHKAHWPWPHPPAGPSATSSATVAPSSSAAPTPVCPTSLPLVVSSALVDSIDADALLGHSQALEDIAYSTPERNRVMGSTGQNLSAEYFFETISSLCDYYDVEYQLFPVVYYEERAANGTIPSADIVTDDSMEYAPSGNVTANLVPVANLGCDLADYPPEVEGAIALISRGTCPFGQKSALAGAAGAVGAFIYNNGAGNVSGTLGVPPRPEGPYVPTLGLSQEQGTALVEQITGGAVIEASIYVDSTLENRTTINVIAESKGGDHDNVLVLGGHADSVTAGPGINDDGSGSAGILEVAIQLSNYSVNNAVRFAWWSGEESGLLGSTYYVENLPEEELAKIRLYLNFDMIASPNYGYFIYDGDGSAFNLTGPPGSAEVEHFFEDFFDANEISTLPTAFDGRSDYGPFLDFNIPAGGLFTGAEDIKTEEEAALFGGTAGIAFDPNYHQAGDNVTNLALDAFEINTRAIAAAVAQYSTSWEGIPGNNATIPERRRMRKRGLAQNTRKKGKCQHKAEHATI